MDVVWRVELFGGIRLLQSDRVVTRFRTQKTAGALGYLGIHIGRPVPREVLMEALWPDGDPELARHNLRNALSTLRHFMEPPGVSPGSVIVTDHSNILLNGDAVSTDVQDFREALRRARAAAGHPDRMAHLERAVAVCGGPLLPGRYEDWAFAAQEELGELYFGAVTQLIAAAERRSEPEAAVGLARAAVRMDPLREDVHRELMRLLGNSGRPNEALRHYRSLQESLCRQMGSAPEPATRAMAEALRSAAGRAAVTEPPPPRETLEPHLAGALTVLMAEAGPGAELDNLRAKLQAHGGRLLSTSPDSLAMGFGRAAEAVEAAVAVLLCAEEGARAVRAALHTGEPGDSDGENAPALLGHASRLLAAAPAGRVLCSEETAILARRRLKPGWRVVDVGLYRLPGESTPEHLYRVEAPGLPVAANEVPLARPFHPPNIPVTLTRFFGREEELDHLLGVLSPGGPRLVTLTGPGGSGKTRLSIQVARELTEAYQGSVWFVPLADCKDAEGIVDSIGDRMRLPRSGGVDRRAQVVSALGERAGLLVLDNFEQLLPDGADVVQGILQDTAFLACLVTSRQTLSLSCEREFLVPPLPLPDVDVDPQPIASSPSVALFVDRAQAVRPDFQVTSRNALTVAAICHRLEGIPLALELAAAHTSHLSPSKLLAELESRFDVLVSTHRDTAGRHRTLRGAIDWSYQLLSPDLQRLFRHLSVFRGGFSAEAAAAVTGEPRAVAMLGQLRERSLLFVRETDAGMRLHMLETLREFAAGRLSPHEQEGLVQSHAEYYLQMAEQAAREMGGGGAPAALSVLRQDLDNLRAVFDRVCDRQLTLDTGLRLADALAQFWVYEGYWKEARSRMLDVLALPPGDSDPCTRAGVLRECASVARRQGDYSASRELLEESLDMCTREGDALGVARSCLRLATTMIDQGDLGAARQLYQRSLDGFRKVSDQAGTAMALNCLARFAVDEGDVVAALSLYRESLAIMRELGDPDGLSNVLGNLGCTLRQIGRLDEARPLLEESLALETSISARSGKAWALRNISELEAAEGHLDQAIEHLRTSLQYSRELDARSNVASVLDMIGELELARGNAAVTTECYRESLELHRELGQDAAVAETLRRLGGIALRDGDEARAAAMLREGLAMLARLERAPGRFLFLGDAAFLAATKGQTDRAVVLYSAALSASDELPAPAFRGARMVVDAALQDLRAQLPAANFDRWHETGAGLAWEKAVALAIDGLPA